MRYGCLVSLTVLALLHPAAQFRSGVDVARFDVIVLDKARQPIAGLTAADFRVTEDGRPLRVAGFEAVTIPGPGTRGEPRTPTAAPSADPRHETVTNTRDIPGRLVVIVLDRTIGSGQPVVTARNVANAAIDALGPNDLAAVVFTSGISGSRPQGFTADRARLRAAVASLIGTPTAVMMTPNGLRHGGPAFPQGECHCGLCAMEKLAIVADALTSVDGYRKMILFIGDDLPMAESSAAGQSAACTGLFGDVRDHLMETVERANVTVHAFNPRGLETGALGADAFRADGRPSPSERLVREGNLETLPAFTGGRTVRSTNQPERLVPAVFEESRTYYLLAVERAPARPDRRPHRVKIDVARPDAIVVSRNAYLDPLPAASKKVAVVPGDPLERALGELLPRTDLPLRMTLAPGTAKNTVDVTLATPIAASVRADVLVGVFDEFSNQIGRERARVDLPASGGSDVEWKMHLNPKPGRYEIRAAVQIGNTIGTVIGHVEAASTDGRAGDASGGAAPPSKAERRSAALGALLAQAGTYLQHYSDPSSGILLEEKYAQQAYDTLTRMRDLKAELLILPDPLEGWIEFRDVLAVDGKPVVDRQDRLQHLFSGGETDPRALGRRIAEEGARHNLNGAVEVNRTLNHPMVPLLYLRAANQDRSEFALEGSAGRDGQHVTFTEVRTPALIGTSGDQTATGEFWIDPATGRVRSAVLRVVSRSPKASITATIRVRYKDNPKIGLVVPDQMEEHYVVRNLGGAVVETIDAAAWYRNPRQFKASASGGQ